MEVFIIQIYYFWKIGRFLYNKKYSCNNIVEKTSCFLSYYYGNSNIFSLENINYMRRFYLLFPIYNKYIEKIDWNCYRRLLVLNRDECYFYYGITIFCCSTLKELDTLINSGVYLRI